MLKYSVECNAPTPLAANPFVCEAEDEACAVEQFKAANGIVDTDYAITATLASERKTKRKKAEPVVEPAATETTGETTEEADEPTV